MSPSSILSQSGSFKLYQKPEVSVADAKEIQEFNILTRHIAAGDGVVTLVQCCPSHQ